MSSWKRNFFLIWAGQAFSQLSSAVLQFAIVWHINGATGSPLALSIAMLLGFLPRALLGPFIGVFIDRYDRRSIMIISDLGIAAVSLLPVIFTYMVGYAPMWVIFLILFLRSLGTAFHDPTLKAVTPQIVPESELVTCAGYNSVLDSVVLIASPIIAAVLYANWSFNAIIMLDVAGAVLAVALLTITQIPKREKPKFPLSLGHVFTETAEGFKILSANRGLMGLVLVSTLYSLAMMPISALFPLMSTAYFGGTEYHASFVEVVFGIGLMVGSVVLGFTKKVKNKIYLIVFSYFLMSGCLLVSGNLSPEGYNIFLVAAWFMGFSGPFFWGSFTPLLQRSFPEEHLGRVMAISSSMTVIASPVGMVVSGLFSEKFGAENWFIIAGFMTFTAGIICLLNTNIRNSGFITEGENYGPPVQ